MLFWSLFVVCAIGIAAAPVLVWLLASGLEAFDGAVLMTRWMVPYIGFMSLVALSAGILNTWKRFAVPAATPVLLNVAMIGAAWWLAPQFAAWGIEPIYALAAGVMVGGVLQLAVQLPALRRVGCLPRIGLGAGRDARRVATSRRAARAAPDGAGAARRVGRAVVDADQHADRVARRASARCHGCSTPIA